MKVSEAAIKAIEEGLSSQDEKIRISCADKLLGHLEAMSKEVNSDQITRLIAEIKFNRRGPAGNLIPQDEKSPMAVVEFDKVR